MLSIVGKNDKVLYALQWKAEGNLHTHFLMQSALDKLDLLLWKNNLYFLKNLDDDKTGNYCIFGYATSKNTKF